MFSTELVAKAGHDPGRIKASSISFILYKSYTLLAILSKDKRSTDFDDFQDMVSVRQPYLISSNLNCIICLRKFVNGSVFHKYLH